MIHPTGTNALVSVIQVIVASDEHGNVQFFQDGLALGAFSISEPDVLLAVLRQGGAEVTDLRTAGLSAEAIASV